MFTHGIKRMKIKNKQTGKVEVIKSNFNFNTDREKKIVSEIKKDWKDSDYKVLSCELIG